MISWPSWAWWLVGLVAALALFVAALPWIIRPLFRLLLAPRYRFRVVGVEHLPKTGPAVVASNHVTWFDGFFLAAISPRHGKALVNAQYINLPVLRWVAHRAGIIPIPSSGPHGQRAAITAVRRALDRGEAVLIFPEAQLTRNGLLGSFYRGLEVMLKGYDHVPVIPVYLGNLWGSILSHSEGRFFLKWPRGLRRTIVVAFGPPVTPPVTTFQVRQAILAAGVRAAELLPEPRRLPETVDLSLPHLEHPELGLLAVSTPNFDRGGIHQTGHKPGTVGQAAPGVALRVVDDAGHPLPADAEGRLQALLPGRSDWAETGLRARIDRDGFVTLASPPPAV
ncbi:MAG: 1-acyl-sn-glycerol-3-phosphate acyltransferase [Isosphaeraceae bacterium]|nr:1-acyl-sn-glycerol-3-phosphate acyltransferase [Isosphaeraceae bacterium]